MAEEVEKNSEELALGYIQAHNGMLYSFQDVLDVFGVFFKGIGTNYDIIDIENARGLLQSGQENVQGSLGGRWRTT